MFGRLKLLKRVSPTFYKIGYFVGLKIKTVKVDELKFSTTRYYEMYRVWYVRLILSFKDV